MGILLGEDDNTPDWDKEIAKIVGEHEEISEIEIKKDKPEKENALLEVNYDISLEEEETAFKLFQRLYVFKSNMIKTLVFVVIAVFFAIQIAIGKGDHITWGLMAVCLGIIAVIWITPVRIRKSLMTALEALKDDRYVFTLFKNRFEIETIIPENEYEEGEERNKVPISKYKLGEDSMRLVETDEMYLVFISKETFHILPKRCLTEAQTEILEKKFINKFDDYLNASVKSSAASDAE